MTELVRLGARSFVPIHAVILSSSLPVKTIVYCVSQRVRTWAKIQSGDREKAPAV